MLQVSADTPGSVTLQPCRGLPPELRPTKPSNCIPMSPSHSQLHEPELCVFTSALPLFPPSSQHCLLAYQAGNLHGMSDSSCSRTPAIHQGPVLSRNRLAHRSSPLVPPPPCHVASCGRQGPSFPTSLPPLPISLTVLLSPHTSASQAWSWHLSSMPLPGTRCSLLVLSYT